MSLLTLYKQIWMKRLDILERKKIWSGILLDSVGPGVSQTLFCHAYSYIGSLVMDKYFSRGQSEKKHIQYQTGPNTELNCTHLDEEVTRDDIGWLVDCHRRFRHLTWGKSFCDCRAPDRKPFSHEYTCEKSDDAKESWNYWVDEGWEERTAGEEKERVHEENKPSTTTRNKGKVTFLPVHSFLDEPWFTRNL